jgi:antitoxin (DNA-binding transcriptional repressor) of toxin-antitoxin stability system
MKTVRRAAPKRPLQLFASLWSLRQYPSLEREWSWAIKFAAIREAGFDGVFSPPIPAIAERGALTYLAVTSLGTGSDCAAPFAAARALGAVAMDVQICDHDTPLARAVAVAKRIRTASEANDLPFAIETHRDTFTETPEATQALARAYRAATSQTLPLCLDHSHFAVVRHIGVGKLWPRLREPASLLQAAKQIHLRPFNGHHCQIPALTPGGQRTPEYVDWLGYVTELFAYEQARRTKAPLLVVAELGNQAPAYRLSCFPDNWRDTRRVAADLRSLWDHGRLPA